MLNLIIIMMQKIRLLMMVTKKSKLRKRNKKWLFHQFFDKIFVVSKET